MKRLSEFIVSKRKLIIVFFLVMTSAGALMISLVNVNYDMTKYLPQDSPTRYGVELMNEEFGEISSIDVMIANLTDKEKVKIYNELEAIKNVDSVTYDAGSKAHNKVYKKSDYALYTVDVKGGSHSDEAVGVLETIKEKYENQEIYLSGTVVDNHSSFLWKLLLFAGGLLFVILFIMCYSWLEPFLFMIAIGMAILINMGTNAFLDSVSSTTHSIAAILQLVLSMDYSIMLMNRYRQEKEAEPDKQIAMKTAIRKAFAPITSSSVTTIAGLLCLVFMSFAIGMDMGIVLAKGVFISLICVLFVLPGLIVSCDKWIEKTKKPVISLPMKRSAAWGYKFRYVILGAFIILFATSYMLKGNTGIDFYTSVSNQDQFKIEEVFSPKNQIVLLYDNNNEAAIGKLTGELKKYKGVSKVSSFANTLGKEYTSAELADEMDMEASLLDIIYYDYFTGGKTGDLTLNTFVSFILNDVASNEQFKSKFDTATLSRLRTLQTFTNVSEMTRDRSITQMAELLSMDKAAMKQLYMAYYSAKGGVNTGKMTLNTFANFIKKDVATNEQYASSFDKATLSQIETMASLTDPKTIKAKLSSVQMAGLLGMESAQARQIFGLYFDSTGSGVPPEDQWIMTMQEFLNLVLETPEISGSMDQATLAQLATIRQLVSYAAAGTSFTSAQMAGIVGMNATVVDQLYLYYISLYGDTGAWRMSAQKMVNFMVDDISKNKIYSAYINASQLSQLKTIQRIIGSAVAGAGYTSSEIAGAMGAGSSMIDENTVDLIYLYYFSKENSDPAWKIPLYDFFGFLIDDVSEDVRFAGYFDSATMKTLKDSRNAMEEGKVELVGENYSRVIIETKYGRESDEVFSLINKLQNKCDAELGEFYLLGDSPMAYEMRKTFDSELNSITILTAIVIFIIVAVTFRSAIIAAVLVLLIQCGVYITMGAAYLQGLSIYYLALLVVQAILMGATIDYAILYTTYYRDMRRNFDIRESILRSYRGSIMTTLTSSGILCGVTLVVGLIVSDATTSEVCMTIAKGAFVAVMLVIFILPGLLAALDRFVVRKKKT